MPRSARRPAALRQRAAAHALVRGAVLSGRLVAPASVACVGCGAPAAVYHHPHGYGPGHELDVEPVCRSCHSLRSHAHTVENLPKLYLTCSDPEELALVRRVRIAAVPAGVSVREWVLQALRDQLERTPPESEDAAPRAE
jgi:hypothetical protein